MALLVNIGGDLINFECFRYISPEGNNLYSVHYQNGSSITVHWDESECLTTYIQREYRRNNKTPVYTETK